MRSAAVLVVLLAATTISSSPVSLPTRDDASAPQSTQQNATLLGATLNSRSWDDWLVKLGIKSAGEATALAKSSAKPLVPELPISEALTEPKLADETVGALPAVVDAQLKASDKKSKYRKAWKKKDEDDKPADNPEDEEKPETLKEHWKSLNSTQKAKFLAGASVVGFAMTLPITGPVSAVTAGVVLGRKDRESNARYLEKQAEADRKARQRRRRKWMCDKEGKCVRLDSARRTSNLSRGYEAPS